MKTTSKKEFLKDNIRSLRKLSYFSRIISLAKKKGYNSEYTIIWETKDQAAKRFFSNYFKAI